MKVCTKGFQFTLSLLKDIGANHAKTLISICFLVSLLLPLMLLLWLTFKPMCGGSQPCLSIGITQGISKIPESRLYIPEQLSQNLQDIFKIPRSLQYATKIEKWHSMSTQNAAFHTFTTKGLDPVSSSQHYLKLLLICSQ